MAPLTENMEMLSHILQDFDEVTGLVTNVQKSMVVPIRCSEIDLEEILHGFPALRSSFPMHYLGLPLLVYRLRSGEFQYIVDKMASQLPGKASMSQPPEGWNWLNPLSHLKPSTVLLFCRSQKAS
jgi:hypothetical protein